MTPPVALYDDKGYIGRIITDEEFENSMLEDQYQWVNEEKGKEIMRKLLSGENVHISQLEDL